MITIQNKLKEFHSIFQVIENLCVETDITFSPEKISIRAVHPSNHCLITFEINKKMFEEYDIKEEATYTLDMQLFNKLLRISGTNKLQIYAEENKLVLKTEKRQFNLNYFVGKKDDRNRPELISTSKWILNSDSFFNTISDLNELSTVCKFHGNDKLEFHTKSDMVNGIVESSSQKIESDGCSAYFDIEYMVLIKDIKSIFKELKLGFSKENPLTLKGANDYLKFEFILAGRVDDDE